MAAQGIRVPSNLKGRARKYYRLGYTDGLKHWMVICPTRRYAEAFWQGYRDGFEASECVEARAFERRREQK